jgi:hypothetical protein
MSSAEGAGVRVGHGVVVGEQLLRVGQSGDLECVELSAREVARVRRDEAVDRPAIELVDHVHGAVRADLDPFVGHATEHRPVLDRRRDGGVLGVEDELEQVSAGRLLREEDGLPGRPPDAVEAPPTRVLREDRADARLEVHDADRARRADLVRPVEVAAGLLARLVDGVHVRQVVDGARVDVEPAVAAEVIRLVGDEILREALGDEEGLEPRGGQLTVGRSRDRVEAHRSGHGRAGGDGEGDRQERGGGRQGRGGSTEETSLDSHGGTPVGDVGRTGGREPRTRP